MKGHTAHAVTVFERENDVFGTFVCIQSPWVAPVNDKGQRQRIGQHVLYGRPRVANERYAQASRRRKQDASPSLANVSQRVPPVPWVSVGTYVVRSAEIKNLDEQIVIDLLYKDVLCPSRSCFVQSVGIFWQRQKQNGPLMLKPLWLNDKSDGQG